MNHLDNRFDALELAIGPCTSVMASNDEVLELAERYLKFLDGAQDSNDSSRFRALRWALQYNYTDTDKALELAERYVEFLNARS